MGATASVQRASAALDKARAAQAAGDFRGAKAQCASVAANVAPFVAALDVLDHASKFGKHTMFPDAIAEESGLGEAIAALTSIAGEPGNRYHTEIDRLKHELTALKSRVHAPADRLRRERAKRAEVEVVCGAEAPALSGWDGEVIGAESYIRQSANDPDSIDVEQCTVPQLTDDRCWLTTCKVRGKNAFGALVLTRYVFSVGKNNTILAATRL